MLFAGLIVACSIVVIAILGTLALRVVVGFEWLARLVLGVQHFDGWRPVWLYDHLEENRRVGSIGAEALLLSRGTAEREFEASGESWRGRVSVRGESWSACSSSPVSSHEEVVIRAVDGLTLSVEPVQSKGRLIGSSSPPGASDDASCDWV